MIGVPVVGNDDGQYPPKLPPTAMYPLLYTYDNNGESDEDCINMAHKQL